MLPLEGRDLLAFEGPHRAMQRAYSDAGIQLQDLDFAEVHDCFTIAELLIYEAMGLAAPGEGHRVLAEGTVRRDGCLLYTSPEIRLCRKSPRSSRKWPLVALAPTKGRR